MSYTAHHDLLTVPVYSPTHKREWMVTPRQYRLLVRLFAGRRFTQRELAIELGYTRGGLADALKSLVSGGLLILHSGRGCRGWTWAKVRAGALAIRNARYLGSTNSENYRENGSPSSESVTAWIASICGTSTRTALSGVLR